MDKVLHAVHVDRNLVIKHRSAYPELVLLRSLPCCDLLSSRSRALRLAASVMAEAEKSRGGAAAKGSPGCAQGPPRPAATQKWQPVHVPSCATRRHRSSPLL